MRQKVILITGAAGEMGQALIQRLAANDNNRLLTLDLDALPPELAGASHHIVGDILDQRLLARLVTQYDFDIIMHLAALLSTRSEFSPELAHRVNVDGTLALMQLAAGQSQSRGQSVQFLFPSSIAAFGVPDLETKSRQERVREWDWNMPTTMYGCNKLYCEQLGAYFGRHYMQLAANRPVMIDFRSVRFPGLISAFTLPTGGTTDYGPEMIHAAAQGEPYACFVRPDSRLPFMAMPDAVTALLNLSEAPRAALTRDVYNVTSFSVTAAEIRRRVLAAFPAADIVYQVDEKRQGIVDSWPADLNDKAARRDWGWEPAYDLERTFSEYLIPNIRRRYQQAERGR